MNVINELVAELSDCSMEYSHGELDREGLNMKLQLIIHQVEQLEIDYKHGPFIYLDSTVKIVFTNLLNRYKSKAIENLTMLIQTGNKASYNRKVRYLLDKKLFFQSLYQTISRSAAAWNFKNREYIPSGVSYFVINTDTKKEKDGAAK